MTVYVYDMDTKMKGTIKKVRYVGRRDNKGIFVVFTDDKGKLTYREFAPTRYKLTMFS